MRKLFSIVLLFICIEAAAQPYTINSKHNDGSWGKPLALHGIIGDSGIVVKIGSAYDTIVVRNVINSLSLATPNVIFGTPASFTNTNGAWSGTLALNSQTAWYVFGNHTSSSATPTFGLLNVHSINATGSSYDGSKVLYDDGTWKTPTGGGGGSGFPAMTNGYTIHGVGGTASYQDSLYFKDTVHNWNSINQSIAVSTFAVYGSEYYHQGTVTKTASSATVTGSGTFFTSYFHDGEQITIGAETKTILSIASNTSLTTTTTFSSSASGSAYTKPSAVARSPIFQTADNGNLTLRAYNIYNMDSSFGVLGMNNVGLGNGALKVFTQQTGDNVAIGTDALYNATAGTQNTAIGNYSQNTTVSASNNTSLGYQSLYTNGGSTNTAIGTQAMFSNVNGSNNTAVGYKAMYTQTTPASSSQNTALGANALFSNTTGNVNTAVGYKALFTSTGSNNTAVGDNALANGGGSNNTALGESAGVSNSGTSNTFLGDQAMSGKGSGDNNIAIGEIAGNGQTSGSFNIVMGSYRKLANLSGSNQLDIGGVIFSGDVYHTTSATSTAVSNPSVGIGTNAPSATAILDLTSTTKGLLLPRMTKAQRDAISSPVAGLAIYQTDNTPGLRVYNGTNWMKYTETTD